jgi:hypothetical protein
LEVPFTTTLTPGNPSLSFSDTTVPVTVFFSCPCAKLTDETKKIPNARGILIDFNKVDKLHFTHLFEYMFFCMFFN